MSRRLRIGWPRHYTALINVGAYAISGQDATLLYTPASDTTPNQFTFIDQIGVAVLTVVTSSAITISGLSIGTSITLNASGGTIDKNGDANFLGSQIVQNGDTVRARLTSSAANSTATNCTVVASPSGVQDVFTATTVASSGATAGATIFWDAVTQDTGGNAITVIGYNIYRGAGTVPIGSTSLYRDDIGAGATQFTDPSPISGVATYFVSALRNTGEESTPAGPILKSN